ncbi:hypothetical protein RI537_14285, partial [Aeromonas salmonicida]|uniref:hypothetical protein n=1 Tax=Aeromonas salmonicida TaxID=645 RepID=UPI00343B7132
VILPTPMLTPRHKRQKNVYLLFLPFAGLSCQVVIFSLKFPRFFCDNCNSASAAVVTEERGTGTQ